MRHPTRLMVSAGDRRGMLRLSRALWAGRGSVARALLETLLAKPRSEGQLWVDDFESFFPETLN